MGRRAAVALVRSSVNIDEVAWVPHIVRPGETLSSSRTDSKLGGKGANVAIAIARGYAVKGDENRPGGVLLAANIGAGDDWITDFLGDDGVNWETVHKLQGERTGTAYIQVAEDGENSIILYKGANYVQNDAIDDPRRLLAPQPSDSSRKALGAVTHVVLQNEIPLGVTKAVLAAASAEPGMTTIFNPSPMLSRDELRAFEWSQVDVLIVNAGEATDLLAAFAAEASEHQQQQQPTDAESIIEALCKAPGIDKVPLVIMTRGGEGVTALLRNKGVQKSVLHVPAGKPARVVDTTGAGDTFAGYVVARLMELHEERAAAATAEAPAERKVVETMGEDEAREVLQNAAWAGALAVESEGAADSIPWKWDVDQRRRAHG